MEARSSNIGGQAVMEGIMMRHKDKYSVGVRRPDGEIELKIEDYRCVFGKGSFCENNHPRGRKLCGRSCDRNEMPDVFGRDRGETKRTRKTPERKLFFPRRKGRLRRKKRTGSLNGFFTVR